MGGLCRAEVRLDVPGVTLCGNCSRYAAGDSGSTALEPHAIARRGVALIDELTAEVMALVGAAATAPVDPRRVSPDRS